MDEDKKLLEAAVSIREHCKKTKVGEHCAFNLGQECDGFHGCEMTGIPRYWAIPKHDVWTNADKALAAGLKANGYNSVTRLHGSESVFVLGRSKTALELGKCFFANLACEEVVNLDDVIGQK